MAHSSAPSRLYLSYPSGKISHIALDVAEPSETPFVNSPQAPKGLATAGEYLFVCDPSGGWVSHYTYSPTGTLISQVDTNYYSHEYIWNEANRKMYFFRDDTSPNDLLWENIDESGAIGEKMDSPYHNSEGFLHPIRVAPDGSIVVLGSGRIFDAISLEHIDALSNNVVDAVWGDGTLFTLRPFDDGTQIQKWGTNYGIVATLKLRGDPFRILAVDEGLLIITIWFGRPWFTIWDHDLHEVYQPPEFFLPAALYRHSTGPQYAWIDATSGGTIVAGADDAYQYVELPFSFEFYGEEYDGLYVSSNGYVSFGAGYFEYENGCIPSTVAPNNAIYAFWDDLYPTGGGNGSVYVKQVDASTFVIEWHGVVHIGGSYPETFEIVLRDDDSITLQYQSVSSAGSATVGVENASGTQAKQYLCNGEGAPLANQLAIGYRTP
jgi:hypothetical protein